MTDNEKKRSTEDKSNPKKDSEKKFKTEGEKERRKLTGMKKKRSWKSTSVKNIH